MNADRLVCGPDGHVPEADLLELSLDGGTPELRARVHACEVCSRRLEELDGFLDHVRANAPLPEATFELQASAASAASNSARRAAVSREDQALIERVLAQTTREDLGARGDLRLIWGFARARLRSSVALRVAAALLVAHLIALPVLAWVVLRAPPAARHFSSCLILPNDPTYPLDSYEEFDAPIGVDEPDVEPRLVEAESAPRDAALGWLDFARREDLARWRRAAPRPAVGRSSTDGLALLLDLRAAQLAGERIAMPALAWSEDIAWSALRVDLLLDRWAATGTRPSELEGALRELCDDPRLVSSKFAACTLHRAAAYGVVGGETWARLTRERGAVSEIALAMTQEPLDRLWLRALDAQRRAGDRDRERAIAAWCKARD